MYFCRMNTYVVDGHDIGKLCDAFSEAENTKGRPTCVLAQTFKGKSLPGTPFIVPFVISLTCRKLQL